MDLNYYNLRDQPFGVTPDPRYLYLSSSHRQALASLYYGIQSRRGFMSLIAKPGMGKTTILLHLLNQLGETARTVFLFQTLCSPEDLLRDLLRDLGVVEHGGDIGQMQEHLNRVLMAEARQGRRVVVVIDEAQNLEDSSLELLRMLSNFETTSYKLMQIILAGQPQLREKLASPHLLQLRQRIAISAGFQPLSTDETRLYVTHRLQVAGYDFRTALFTPRARALIAKYSEGIPRNINNICFNALSLGWALEQRTIEKEVVREAIRDMTLEGEEVTRLHHEPVVPRLLGWILHKPVFPLSFSLGKRISVAALLLLTLVLLPSGARPDGAGSRLARSSMSLQLTPNQLALEASEGGFTTIGATASATPPVDAQSVAKPAAVEDSSTPETTSLASRRNATIQLHSTRVHEATPDELWVQVKNENSDAEVELARMYLEGTSVPRDCTQAQILLQAASRRGNKHATDLLNDREGQCR